MAGKGSAPRKDQNGSAKKKYDSNWDRIFKSSNLTQVSEKAEFHENGVSYTPKK